MQLRRTIFLVIFLCGCQLASPTPESAPPSWTIETDLNPSQVPAPSFILPSPEPTVQISQPTFQPTSAPTQTRLIQPDPTESSPQVCSPLEGHSILELRELVSHPFEMPRPGRDDGHHGVDFAYFRRGDRLSIEGVPVQSVFSGVVAGLIVDRTPYGNAVLIESRTQDIPRGISQEAGLAPNQSLYHLYAHLAAPVAFRIGDPVACGQFIGAVGSTGNSGNPHLHLELRIGPAGQRFPEMAFYDTRANPEEMETYRLWRMSGIYLPTDPVRFFTLTP